jgi:regulator of replication initiation timing
MSSVADQLNSVMQKTARLIELCSALQEENELLKLENQQTKVVLDAAKTKTLELDEKLRVLKLAKSIEGTSEKTLDIKQKINEFVREIDKCVVLLKK